MGIWTRIGNALKAFDSSPVETKGAGSYFNAVAGSDSERGEFVDAYTQSVYAMAAINRIGRNLASARLDVFADREQSTRIEDPRIGEWTNRPAVGFKWSQFIEATNLWLKARGHFFWLLGDEWVPHLDVVGKAPPLILANADRMTPVREGGELVGWRYIDDGHRTHILEPRNVIRKGYYNPADPYEGLSPLIAARAATEADFYASRFQRNAMKSNGEKGSIISPKGVGTLSEPQETQIKATLAQHARLRAKGDTKPLFFSGEVEVKDPQVMPIDASFFEGCRMSGEKIFLALDLPPSMASVQVSNSIGSASDFYRMLTDAVMPTGDLICDGVDEVLERLTGRMVYSQFNFADHPVMQEVREAKTDNAVKLWNMGMPLKDVSDTLGLGLPRVKGDDVGYLPFSVAPVGSADLGDPAEDPATAEVEEDEEEEVEEEISEDEDVQEMFRALAGIATKVAPTTKGRRMSASDRTAWARQMKLRKPWEKKIASAFRRELMTARSEVLANIDALDTGKDAGDSVYKGVAADLMFNLSTWKAGLLQRLRKVSAASLKAAGEEEWDALEQSDPFNQPTAFVDQFLQSRENFMVGVADNVFRSVQRQLEAGIDAGESMAKLAGRVRAQFNQIADARALRIAQTEVGHAYEAARTKAQKDAGVQYKKWVTTGNSNVRHSHEQAHGQIKRIDEPFEVGGHQLMHPLDGSLGAPAEEIINCHCMSVAVRKPD